MDYTYTKLFASIIASTIWREDDKTRIVWITLLALADQFGDVAGSIPGLAALANVPLLDCERALAKLMSPDLYSRDKEYEGRRVIVVDGGWHLLNHPKYRARHNDEDRRRQNREAQQRWRQRQHKQNISKNKQLSADVDAESAKAKAEADTDTKKEKEEEKETPVVPGGDGKGGDSLSPEQEQFEQARSIYPGVKRGLKTEWDNFRKKHKDWREVLPDLKAAIELLTWEREAKAKRKEFIPDWPHFRTWINQRRWEQAEHVEI